MATVKIADTGNIAQRGTVNLDFYLSADAVLDNSDPLLATVIGKSISLKPGAQQAASFKIAIPPGTAVGAYFLFATMTPAASIGDANPGNNVAISSQRVAVVNTLPHPTRIVNQISNVNVIVNVDQSTAVYNTDSGCCTGSSDQVVVSDSSSNAASDQSDSSQCDSSTADSQPATPNGSSSDDSSSSDSWDSTDGDVGSSGGDF
jgi:hypothetical protein